MKKYKQFWTGFIAAVAIMLMLVIPKQCVNGKHFNTVSETTSTTTDTVPKFYDSPVPADSTVIRYVTVEVPVAVERYDTISVALEATHDTVAVTLPIEQKVYEDSTYKAWVSGFMPALDSIVVYQPVITNTITRTEIVKQTKRWGVGIQAGAGITPSKIEPYIGIGVTYNIFSW